MSERVTRRTGLNRTMLRAASLSAAAQTAGGPNVLSKPQDDDLRAEYQPYIAFNELQLSGRAKPLGRRRAVWSVSPRTGYRHRQPDTHEEASKGLRQMLSIGR